MPQPVGKQEKQEIQQNIEHVEVQIELGALHVRGYS